MTDANLWQALIYWPLFLMAGIYLIFSNTLMRVLAKLPAAEGAKVMDSINRIIINPVFLTLFVGSGLASIYLIFNALLDNNLFLLAAAGVFFVGSTLVTILCNVPLNDKLAIAVVLVKEQSACSLQRDLENYWQSYLVKWSKWNWVRTVCSASSCFLLLLSF
ncbi:DUF1772 domain-containing protein [Neptunicella marina]|uniref:DUF1772 domain-containing protein n=1 Tax=Neptunicella marina TaxID=2125989 RepID=A0A8J6M6C2_9ALTE|nr:anthrone oxygenase family protein [Neptunicella marina]MBC3767046.1 DUF1772 domain-containing protein [Neptunicella marina]